MSYNTAKGREHATCMGEDSLAATAEKKRTSGQMSLMTVALNFFKLQLEKRGFSATILRGRAVCYPGKSWAGRRVLQQGGTDKRRASHRI